MTDRAPNTVPANALEARRLIQSGLTGDKIPGIDPAAAPMETDQEAGSDSAPSGPINVHAKPVRPPESSSATAMRRPHEDAPPSGSVWWLIALLAGFVIIGATVAFVIV